MCCEVVREDIRSFEEILEVPFVVGREVGKEQTARLILTFRWRSIRDRHADGGFEVSLLGLVVPLALTEELEVSRHTLWRALSQEAAK